MHARWRVLPPRTLRLPLDVGLMDGPYFPAFGGGEGMGGGPVERRLLTGERPAALGSVL